MFKFINKDNQISLLQCAPNMVTYKKDNYFFVNEEVVEVDPLLWIIIKEFSKVYIKSSSWENFSFDLREKKLRKLDYNVAVNGRCNNFLLCNNGNYFVIDISNNDILYELSFSVEKINYYMFNSNQIIFQSENLISSALNQLIWQTSLSFYGTITKLLGICKNILWVSLTKDVSISRRDISLIGLDVNTGSVVMEQVNLPYFDDVACVLDEEKQIVISISNQLNKTYFVEIDAETGQVLRQKQLEDLEERGFTFAISKGITLYKNELYIIVASSNTLFGCGVAVLDLDNLQIKTAFKLEGTKGGIANPVQVNDKGLYVLDNNGTLFIYERDDV